MSSGQPADTVVTTDGDTLTTTSGSDSVKYDTYKKLLGEKKAADQRARDFEERLSAAESDKMRSEGNTEALLLKIQEENANLKKSLTQKEQAFAYATLGSQVKTEAARMGCQDPDSLVKLMDLKGIPVDPETFRADTDALRMMLESEKNTRPFYFGKPAPNVLDVKRQDVVFSNDPMGEHDISKMSRDQLAAYVTKYGSKLE